MNSKFEEIKEENFVIFIYFILLFIYLYANKIEVNYLNTGNSYDKDLYRILLFIVFGISFLITLYYVISSYSSLFDYDNDNIYDLKRLSFFATLLVLIATWIFLYIIYKDEDINLEVSP